MKIITTTTINPPTPAIRLYDAMPDWHLIVAGDLATPEYRLERGEYLSWEAQQFLCPKLCKLLGPNSIARGRMIAWIEARKRGCTLLASIDDDCEPIEGWGQSLVGQDTKARRYTAMLAFDPMAALEMTAPHARGFPLQQSRSWRIDDEHAPIHPLIQQNHSLVQGDYYALARLQDRDYGWTAFAKEPYFSGSFCPVNTQNTLIHGDYLHDFYANIPGIGRADDIWAGYLFQARHPESVIYCEATVEHRQERSFESLLGDLQDEIFCMRHTLGFLYSLRDDGPETAMKKFLPEIALRAIDLYRTEMA